ncbi:hypothetical protein O181_005397 [Austropuccinia psidii MF-1]|uniref:Uncharacterized protein n=1 Tax=Austropuccinia psidii MF-1 TaxID=1389203 RepID=A0A9Q3BI09_9BASI|nr:hypothetical protein [Austropuccinia psidii MF-1]
MSFENEQYSVEKDPYEWCLRQSRRLKAIDPQMKIQMWSQKLLTQILRELEHTIKYKPKEGVVEVTKKKNSCHNCGSTDRYANNFPKENKKFYAIEQVPEEELPTEDSESDSMCDAIREHCNDDPYPKKEFLVEYQEETQLETQDRQLEAGMPQDTANKNLCKHTQD